MANDEYTPTDEEVRTDYVMTYADRDSSQLLAGMAFDRWLSAHDARVRAEAWDEGHSWGWADYEDHATTMTLDLDDMPSRAEASTMRNPYEKEADRGE